MTDGLVIVHAGNRPDEAGRTVPRFPESQVPAVAAAIGRLLDALRPALVLSAPAAGADLIVLGEAQRLGVAVHVLLPLPEDAFEEASVADRGAAWVVRYRAVLAAARAADGSCVDERDLRGDGDWYLTGNALLVDAAHRAAPAGRLLALAVRPWPAGDPPSATDDFAHRAAAAGVPVITLDPRPGCDDVMLDG